MTKLEAWKAWCASAGALDLCNRFSLEQSSHGKAFSFAWEHGVVEGMQHQMKSSVEKALETKQEPLSQVKWDASAPLVMGEPVAWRSTSPDGKLSNEFVGTSKEVNWTPIYTAPPQREWVGLTDEEFKFIASKYSLSTQTGMEYFKDELEAKLKEKNHG